MSGLPAGLPPELLVSAYAQGYFPMAEPDSDDIYWFDPDPRTVLPFEGLHVSRSLARTLRRGTFVVTFDQCFRAVMQACAEPAPGREETWISEDFVEAYSELFALGFAHSAEVWQQDRLVGGVYGVSIGGFFAGESMFSRVSNGSKIALVSLMRHLQGRGYVLFDVQFMTEHLRRLGAVEIARADYKQRLARAIHLPVTFDWATNC